MLELDPLSLNPNDITYTCVTLDTLLNLSKSWAPHYKAELIIPKPQGCCENSMC